MDGKADQWTEEINSAVLRTLFESFDVEVSEDAYKLSFAKELLEVAKLKEFKHEMNSLAGEVVLFRDLPKTDITPGTVCVCEVYLECKYNEGEIEIEEKDSEIKNFIFMKNSNIVKIILIHSKHLNVIEAKEILYQKYGIFFPPQECYFQHVSEDYEEVSKRIGHRKIKMYTRLVESLIEMIPVDDIEHIIDRAADRSFSRESITRLCFSAVVQESGNTDSGPYYCRSFFTIRRLKRELVENTMESMRKSLVSEVESEIHQHIAKYVRDRVGPIQSLISLTSPTIINSIIFGIAIIVAIWFNVIPVLIVSAFVIIASFLFAVDVNSFQWRKNVANEIYENLSRNKEKVIKDISSNIKQRCKETVDQLRSVSSQLEDFKRRTNLIDQDKEASEWEKRHVIKDNATLRKNNSIITYIAGRNENDMPIVKVILRYPDYKAKLLFKDNIEKEFVTISELTKQNANIVNKIKSNEFRKRAVSESKKSHLSEIIYSQADRLYANHSTIVGIGISNVRCINGYFIREPCIVIYCSDKSIIPFGEKPLPTSINGCHCDIRENIFLLGICDDCGEENARPGCSIGITTSNVFGSAGFLAKSNKTNRTGFLTAAHVVIRKLEKLYFANAFLSECNDGDESNVVAHPSECHAGGQSKSIGEVIESYCGNYQSAGMDAAFVANYNPTARVHTPLQIADENDFKNDHGIFVRKKGKATGITEGILVSGLFTIGISRIVSPTIYRFDYCYRIIDKPGVRTFFEPGDSGSGVYLIDKRGKKKPLGIAFARSIHGDTVACRIENVTRAFDLSLYDEEGPVTEPMEVDVEPMEVDVDFGEMFEMLELMDIP